MIKTLIIAVVFLGHTLRGFDNLQQEGAKIIVGVITLLLSSVDSKQIITIRYKCTSGHTRSLNVDYVKNYFLDYIYHCWYIGLHT